MEMGFAAPVSGSWATPDNLAEVAHRAEELGYRTLWTFQRLLYPSGGRGWAPVYRSVLDPLVTLGFLAAQTSRIRLGVAVVNAPFYSPALLAKQLTTVDVLSGGRLVAGLGLGWSDEEYVASGVPKEGRGRRLAEHIEVLTQLWTGDVTHEGEHYRLLPSRQDPKPVQRPHPPILLGGSAEPALRRAGRLADGWISASMFSPDQIASAIATIREAAEQAGRDPGALSFVCRGSVAVRPEPLEGMPYSGPIDLVRQRIAEVAEAGITEFFVDPNFDPAVGSPDADPAATMDRVRELLADLAPDRPGTG
ncbi:MAG: LLM class flavin-dependent oxidoreductase [Frankiaceae bacterium]